MCSGRSADVAAATEASLVHLTGLTQLVLNAAPAVPSALTSLTNLARFSFKGGSGRTHLPAPDSLQLPGGAWLAGLQLLCAPGGMVAASFEELAPEATPRLHTVHIPGFSEQPPPVQARILDWASRHPGLRRLEINAVVSEGTLRALVAAMDRKPALAVGFGSGRGDGLYASQLWPEAEPV